MSKNNKQSHKTSTAPNKSGYHDHEIKKASYKVDSDQYKDMDFNFSVNTKYLCKEEVAEKLGIAEPTLIVKIRAKEIPLPLKLKSKNLWKRSEIESYVDSTKRD